MKFALVFAYDPTVASPTEEEMPAWLSFDEEVRSANVFVHDAGFHPRDEARIVRLENGVPSVDNKPVAPAAHTVAGFYVLDVADIDAATEWAAKLPTASYGYVEIRQVVEWEG